MNNLFMGFYPDAVFNRTNQRMPNIPDLEYEVVNTDTGNVTFRGELDLCLMIRPVSASEIRRCDNGESVYYLSSDRMGWLYIANRKPATPDVETTDTKSTTLNSNSSNKTASAIKPDTLGEDVTPAQWQRIYIAAPYTNENPAIVEGNVQHAIAIGARVMAKGHQPFIPHLGHYIQKSAYANGIPSGFSYERWMVWCFGFLAQCHAILHVSSSPGADDELDYAIDAGMIIYTDESDVPNITGSDSVSMKSNSTSGNTFYGNSIMLSMPIYQSESEVPAIADTAAGDGVEFSKNMAAPSQPISAIAGNANN